MKNALINVILAWIICMGFITSKACDLVNLSMFDGGNEVLNGTAYHIFDSNGVELLGGTSNSVDEWFDSICLENGCYTLEIEANGPGNPITWFLDSSGLSENGSGPGTFSFAIGVVSGCTESSACNFNPDAICNDGSCTFFGCTNDSASNYNPEAGCDDGSCCFENFITFTITYLTPQFPQLSDLTWQLSDGDDQLQAGPITGISTIFSVCLGEDCYLLEIEDFNSSHQYQVIASGIDETHYDTFDYFNSNGRHFQFSTNNPVGCTDIGASNYTPVSECFAPTCIYPDCTDPAACNYNRHATEDNGSCVYPNGNFAVQLIGDTIASFNVNYSITQNGNVVIPLNSMTAFSAESFCLEPGCYEINLSNSSCANTGGIPSQVCETVHVLVNGVEFTSLHGIGNGTIVTESFCILSGCTNPSACNYVPNATVEEPCEFPGCTNDSACNYNSLAGCDDGSCLVGSPLLLRITNSMVSPAIINYSFSTSFGGPAVVSGSANAMAGQQVFTLCIPEDCYLFNISGMGAGDNWQLGTIQNGNVFVSLQNTLNSGNTNISNNSVCYLFGCADNSACNYNGFASVDDGTCLYDCTLCTTLEMYDQGDETLNGTVVNIYDSSMQLIETYTSHQIDEDYPGICTEEAGCYFIEFIPADTNGEPILWTMTIDGNVYSGTGNGIYGFSPSGTLGCTEENASNYNSDASCDDGSCVFLGCTDPMACNYDSQATVDNGTCGEAGCLDPAACNYEPLAVCNAPCYFNGMDVQVNVTNPGAPTEIVISFLEPAFGSVYHQVLLTIDDVVSYASCIPSGCFIVDVEGITIDGNFVDVFVNGAFLGNVGLGGLVCPEFGCTDINACNYDPVAMVNNGSCSFPGCTNPDACNYDASACVDNGSCNAGGCTDVLAQNYDPTATCDNGSCCYNLYSTFQIDHITPEYGLGINAFYELLDLADVDNILYTGLLTGDHTTFSACLEIGCYLLRIKNVTGYHQFEVSGSGIDDTQVAQFQYETSLGQFFRFSTGNPIGCNDPLASNYVPDAGCSTPCIYPDCTDPLACNYNYLATEEDGSCVYPDGEVHLTLVGASNIRLFHLPYSISQNGSVLASGVITFGEVEVFCIPPGCTTISISSALCFTNGICEELSVYVNGVFQTILVGTSNSDSGSDTETLCLFPGCTDVSACNYDPSANSNDGTCEYTSCLCPGDFDSNSVTNTGDMLLFMAEFACVSNCGAFDLDGNSVVNTGDLLLLMAAFGTSCN